MPDLSAEIMVLFDKKQTLLMQLGLFAAVEEVLRYQPNIIG